MTSENTTSFKAQYRVVKDNQLAILKDLKAANAELKRLRPLMQAEKDKSPIVVKTVDPQVVAAKEAAKAEIQVQKEIARKQKEVERNQRRAAREIELVAKKNVRSSLPADQNERINSLLQNPARGTSDALTELLYAQSKVAKEVVNSASV